LRLTASRAILGTQMEAAPSLLIPSSVVDMYDGTKKQRLLLAVVGAVRASFETHPMRCQTAAEQKRRTDICLKGFRLLRNENKYSFDRACDTMGQVLAAALDLRDHKVSTRNGWFAR
jgi:hypothetical protein